MATRHPSTARELRNMTPSFIRSIKSGLKTKLNRVLPSNSSQPSNILSEKLQRKIVKQKLFHLRTWYLFCGAGWVVILLSSLAAIGVFSQIRTMASTSTTTTATATTIILSFGWNSTGTTVVSDASGGPTALAIDSSNALYVAETSLNRIQKYVIGSSNTSTTVAGQTNGASGNTSAFLNYPIGVAVDSNDNVYALDKYNNRIQLWNSGASNGVTVAGFNGSGNALNQLIFPYCFMRDPNTGTFYISNNGNNRVVQYLLNASSASPSGVYFESSSNNLVIANFLGHNTVHWKLGASNWALIAGTTGVSGSSSTTLNNPMGLTLDPYGNIYVADQSNNRIQFFSNNSNGITIAGTGTTGNSATTLNGPSAVALDSQLNLYVADAGNQRIQKFSRS
ncbi:unnamed protein product [Rotaria socialis]